MADILLCHTMILLLDAEHSRCSHDDPRIRDIEHAIAAWTERAQRAAEMERVVGPFLGI